ncbi:MAG: hypothetical protein M0037_15710 [Betaproteobacteria bacterium]|nr:hypothetical protein [Betaproteobacteria bacterium]
MKNIGGVTKGDRLFMFLSGSAIVLGLYFSWPGLLYGVAAVLLLEGLLDRRSSSLLSWLLGGGRAARVEGRLPRASVDAGRAWRLLMGLAVLVSVLFLKHLWFLAWFVGFVVAGAGISGVCPGLMLLQRMGLR